MWKWRSRNSKSDESSLDASLREVSGPILNVLLGNDCIATIYYDGTDYCLVYTRKFLETGLTPFNTNDLSKGEVPDVDRIYRSRELWHAFTSRLPSPNRDDYKRLLDSMGLTGNENPLLILGKVGRISIAKPWKLELVSGKKVS